MSFKGSILGLILSIYLTLLTITLTMEGMKGWLKENLLLFLTFTGVLSGFVLGILLRTFDLSQETILLIAYPGELFMRLLNLMILPPVLSPEQPA